MRKKRTAAATAAHMRNATKRRDEAEKRTNSPIARVSAAEMVAASLYTGTTYQQQSDSLMMMNIQPGSRSSFFRCQKAAEPKIKAAADESTAKARKNFSGAAALDCRWSHRIRGQQGTIIMADIESPQRSILARETLVTNGGGRQNPNYDGLPGNMESVGTDRMLNKAQNEGFLEKITSITRDRDNKSGKILDKYGIRDREFHDPGHYKKNFSTLLANFIKKYPEYEYYENSTFVYINSPFWGLQGPLQYYLAKVMKEEDADIREHKWMNAVNHFIGNHEFCDHDEKQESYFWRTGYDHPPLQKILYNFLAETAPVVRKIYANHRTQLIEAINNEIAHNAPKDISWKRIEIRIDATIIKHNEPEEAPQIIRECCGVKAPCQFIQEKWENRTRKIVERREESHQKEVLREKNKRRYEAKGKNSGSCDYKEKSGWIKIENKKNEPPKMSWTGVTDDD